MWTWCDLSWELGSKSEVLNIDCPDLDKYPLFPKARRYECSLDAGDVLFIPGKALDHTSVFSVCLSRCTGAYHCITAASRLQDSELLYRVQPPGNRLYHLV